MNILVEYLGNEVVVALIGSADSLQYDNQASVAVFQRLGEQAARRRPDRIWVDFQGLTYIDSAAFHQIADQISRIRKKHPQIELVGPGPALERLLSLIDPPRWWTWSRPRENPAPVEKPKAETPRRRSTDAKAPPAAGGRTQAVEPSPAGAVTVGEPPRETELELAGESQTDEEAAPAPREAAALEPSASRAAEEAGRIERQYAVEEDYLPADLESPAAETDVFEIDLDRELLFLESEPPGEEFNPMADPVDLTGSWKMHAMRHPSSVPSAAVIDPVDPASEDLPPDFPEGNVDRDPPFAEEEDRDGATGEPVEGDPLLFDVVEPMPRTGVEPPSEGYADSELSLSDETAGGEPDAPAPRPYSGVGGSTYASPRAARAAYEALAARIRELERERSILHSLLAEARGQPPAPARPTETARRRMDRSTATPARAGSSRPRPRLSDPAVLRSPGDRSSPITAATDGIPAYLRGDVARSRIIRAVASVIEDRRRGRPLSPSGLRRIASAMAKAAQRAPFAVFDLRQARERLALEARLVHTTGIALCAAVRGGARLRRLGTLALTSLVWGLVDGGREALSELTGGQAAAANLARRLHLKVLQVLGPGRGIPEDRVRQDVWLLSLAREFWRRLGSGVSGGTEPAVLMAAIERGEIARPAPAGLRRLFIEAFSAYPPGSWVRLESGEVGIVVAPGSVDPAGPLVLCLFAGGERELRLRPPRMADTGGERGSRIQAVVRSPMPRCAVPRDVLRVREGLSMK